MICWLNQDDTLTGSVSSVDVSTESNMDELVNVGEGLLKKPVSRVNLDKGICEPLNQETNEEALRRYVCIYVCICASIFIIILQIYQESKGFYIEIFICIGVQRCSLMKGSFDLLGHPMDTSWATPCRLHIPQQSDDNRNPSAILFPSSFIHSICYLVYYNYTLNSRV